MFVVEILGDTQAGSTFYINYSPTAITSIGLSSFPLVLGITIYYFVPRKTWMPLMAGSARLVFESCKGLSSQLPVKGIAWGDISTEAMYDAGFGEEVCPVIVGVVYPSGVKEGIDLVKEASEVTVSENSGLGFGIQEE